MRIGRHRQNRHPLSRIKDTQKTYTHARTYAQLSTHKCACQTNAGPKSAIRNETRHTRSDRTQLGLVPGHCLCRSLALSVIVSHRVRIGFPFWPSFMNGSRNVINSSDAACVSLLLRTCTVWMMVDLVDPCVCVDLMLLYIYSTIVHAQQCVWPAHRRKVKTQRAQIQFHRRRIPKRRATMCVWPFDAHAINTK